MPATPRRTLDLTPCLPHPAACLPYPSPLAALPGAGVQNGMYLQLRGCIQERMGEFYEAIMDYTAALPLLKASGGVLSECIFNRGYCHR